MAEQVPFYIFTAFIFSYGMDTVHVSAISCAIYIAACAVISLISGRP
jgi:hypothetical protein